MIERHIEVESPGRVVRKSRGSLSITAPDGGAEDADIPLDTVASLTLHRTVLASVSALLGVMHEGGAVTLCGDSYEPEALLWPISGHHQQARRLEAQITAPAPLRKRIWQSVVIRKIAAQGEILEYVTGEDPLCGLARRVGSGDPRNVEAQAARRYWPGIMGPAFRRGDPENPINGMLNYGYAIVRSAMARSVASTGLHPSISIHHHDARNAFALVDDLMEPYRPLVDVTVWRIIESGVRGVDRDVKNALSGLLVADLKCDIGTTPVFAAARRTALSLAQSFEERTAAVIYPNSMLPC